MAAEIKAKHPEAVVELVPSKGGRFEVSMDGRAIFEKSKAGRHAEPGEILAKIGAGEKRAKGGQ